MHLRFSLSSHNSSFIFILSCVLLHLSSSFPTRPICSKCQHVKSIPALVANLFLCMEILVFVLDVIIQSVFISLRKLMRLRYFKAGIVSNIDSNTQYTRVKTNFNFTYASYTNFKRPIGTSNSMSLLSTSSSSSSPSAYNLPRSTHISEEVKFQRQRIDPSKAQPEIHRSGKYNTLTMLSNTSTKLIP